MKRRDFLLLPGAMAMAWNQASAKVETLRIGLVHAGSRQENHALLDAFRDGLSALGWTDGSNLSVLDRWAEERTEVLPALVKELIGSGVTILVTAGTSATLAATRANATIPIVLVGVDDPVSLGLVDTLMQPGGKVTGLSLSSSEVIAERLELLRQLVRPCRTAMEPRGPTLKRHSWLHQRIVGLARKRSSASDWSTCRRPAHVNSSSSPFASFRSAVLKPSVNQP